jgi:hypothetical protein
VVARRSVQDVGVISAARKEFLMGTKRERGVKRRRIDQSARLDVESAERSEASAVRRRGGLCRSIRPDNGQIGDRQIAPPR